MAQHSILIIDDDPVHHIILGNFLERQGFRVVHAHDGQEGLDALSREVPDLLLLDILMPGIDGFQLITKIKKNSRYTGVPILFLTGQKRQDIVNLGLELGADDYVTKPFVREELMARIRAVLRRSRQEDEREGRMAGTLRDVGISDLLQSFELGLKTAAIRMPEMDADIIIRNGRLVHVRMGGFTGDQALLRIFLLEKGRFAVRFNEIPEGFRESPRSLTSVLMSVSSQVDEIRDIIERMGVKNRRIIMRGDLSAFPALEKVKALTPATVIEIISAMDGNLKTNIKTIVDAVSRRIIKVEKR